MRTREEIEKIVEPKPWDRFSQAEYIFLEVLLDIRDLLTKESND